MGWCGVPDGVSGLNCRLPAHSSAMQILCVCVCGGGGGGGLGGLQGCLVGM